MTASRTKIVSLLMIVVMFFAMSMVLSACKDKAGNGTFTGIQIKYSELVSANVDVFDINGDIRLVYRNADLNTLISTDNNYAKLGQNALYEPLLNASIKIFSCYITRLNMDAVSVSKKQAEALDSAYEVFKTKLNNFVAAKTNLEARDTISATGVVEQSLFAILCDKYKELIDASCTLGEKMSSLYRADIFEDYIPDAQQRHPVGKMKLVVLEKLNEFARLEYNNRMAYYHDKEYKNPVESNTQKVLAAYNKIKAIELWEGSSPTISNDEKQIINIFSNMLDYDEMYQLSVKDYDYALGKIDLAHYYKYLSGAYAQDEFTDEEFVYFAKIDEYFATNAANMINYITKLSNKIYAFKTA